MDFGAIALLSNFWKISVGNTFSYHFTFDHRPSDSATYSESNDIEVMAIDIHLLTEQINKQIFVMAAVCMYVCIMNCSEKSVSVEI